MIGLYILLSAATLSLNRAGAKTYISPNKVSWIV